ncbi:MAG TPA: hypothetical protein VE913_23030 [Longimicrobium sp.]|nr:hypothetical protein [Longimicrobium sp.]
MDVEALTTLIAVTLGTLIPLVFVTGITARIALKPVVESFIRLKESRGGDEKVALMEQRLALLEEHLHSIDRSVGALHEEADFRRQLDSGASQRTR